ncbi:hypothetical protein DL96DRAFT_540447 [Flagelloscypha sp. PMI_526]|nr:hypothetical protein DL96DRAFT_540447 [Flagelloscypha sp. PMI_526]
MNPQNGPFLPATPAHLPSSLRPSSQDNTVSNEKQGLFDDPTFGIKEETDLRLYSWQKDASALHSLKSISEDFAELHRAPRIQEKIQLSGHQDGFDRSGFRCPGYRRDDIRMSLSLQACAIFVYDTPQQGEVCKACGKEHEGHAEESAEDVPQKTLETDGWSRQDLPREEGSLTGDNGSTHELERQNSPLRGQIIKKQIRLSQPIQEKGALMPLLLGELQVMFEKEKALRIEAELRFDNLKRVLSDQLR